MKLSRSVVLAVAVVIVMTAPVYAGLAPSNPECLKWKDARTDRVNTSEVADPAKYETGYIPSPVNLSHLRSNPAVIAAAEDELSVSYDLRALGRFTPIRNQDCCGTCWSFAATATIESNYLTHVINNDGRVDGSLGDAETLAFSDLHQAWYMKNNPDKSRMITGGVVSRIDPALANLHGGLPAFCVAYYSRLDGSVLEADLPYISYEAISNDAGYSINEWNTLLVNGLLPSYGEFQMLTRLRTGGLPDAYTPAHAYEPKLRLTDALYGTCNPLVSEEGFYTSGDKQYIVGEFIYDRIHHSYYYVGDTSSYINHGVAIIGWDDNFSRDDFLSSDVKPNNNGARLIRNSWGDDWPASDAGYFWMSYEQPIMEGVAFVVEDMPAGIKVYEYDPLGCCNGFGDGEKKTIWGANTFKVKSDGETLESIAFYTTDNNATCEWSIYYGMTDRPSSAPYTDGATRVSGSNTYPYAGYHTLKLDSPIKLTKGQYFAIVVKFTNANHGYHVGVEGKAVVHDRESWFSDDGIQWIDGATIEGVVRGRENVIQSIPLNACIKAFTIDTVSDDEAEADEDTILGINEKFAEGTLVAFYLVNRTSEREFTATYTAETDTRYPSGLMPTAETEYDLLFAPGSENGLEFPAYGPFVASTDANSCISLDVNKLEDIDGNKCSIPKGYYDVVYFEPNLEDDDSEDVPFTGKISLSSTTPCMDQLCLSA